MSIRRNTLANLLGTAYSVLAALIVVPLYLAYMSPDAYGLVGFFVLAQAWLALLDLGLSQVLLRAAAMRDAEEPERFYTLLRSIEGFFLVLVLALVLVSHFAAQPLTQFWLDMGTLDPAEVVMSLRLMGMTIALRLWMAIYKSCLQGLELQVRLNGLNVIGATLRYPGALVLLHFQGIDFTTFFAYQLLITVIEFVAAAGLVYVTLPPEWRFRWVFRKDVLRGVAPFALSVAYAGIISTVLVQVDRLAFSTVLPLAEFGFLAVLTFISAGIVQLSGPLNQAVLPRLAALHGDSGSNGEFQRVYLGGAEALSLLLTPVALVIVFYAHPLLLAWTGSVAAADWGQGALRWYALGNLFMALSSGPYFLQYVRGDLGWHTRYITAMAVVQTPILIALAYHRNVEWVAATWCIFRLADMLLWSRFIHGRLAPGVYLRWLRSIAGPCLACFLILVPTLAVSGDLKGLARAEVMIVLAAVALLTFLAAVLLSSLGRRQLRAFSSGRIGL